MTLDDMVAAARFAYAKARAKDGRKFDPEALTRALAADCSDHGLDYDLVLDQVQSALFREFLSVSTYQRAA